MGAFERRSAAGKRVLSIFLFTLTACLGLSVQSLSAQVAADEPGQRTVILIDAAHHNAWNSGSLIEFLDDEGFQVRQLRGQFDREVFSGVDIILIAGALSAQNAVPDNLNQEEFDRAWRLPTSSAFEEHEIALLKEWVETGGALLLVADHMPLAGAIGDLAQAFDIEVSNGFAVDESVLTDLSEKSVANAGAIVFRRSDGTLAKHSVTDGRSGAERVEAVAAYVGSAFRLPEHGESLLRFGPKYISLQPEIAWRFPEDTVRKSIENWSQGGLLRVGRGRLAIFGELGILATPEAIAKDPDPDNPQRENPQLLLNVLYWLSGLMEVQ